MSSQFRLGKFTAEAIHRLTSGAGVRTSGLGSLFEVPLQVRVNEHRGCTVTDPEEGGKPKQNRTTNRNKKMCPESGFECRFHVCENLSLPLSF